MGNHSCTPNCVLMYEFCTGETPAQVIRAVVDISEGDELTHSYVDLALPTHKRKKHLRETYNFECTCSLCASSSKARSELDGTLYADCTGKFAVPFEEGCQLPPAETSEQRDAALLRSASLMNQAAGEEDVEAELAMLQEACALRELWLHRRHLDVMAAHAAALTVALAAASSSGSSEGPYWTAAEAHCAYLVEQYIAVYPLWHPVSGLQMYTLGQLKEQRGALAEARGWYAQAASILSNTHGADNQMVVDLREFMQSLPKGSEVELNDLLQWLPVVA